MESPYLVPTGYLYYNLIFMLSLSWAISCQGSDSASMVLSLSSTFSFICMIIRINKVIDIVQIVGIVGEYLVHCDGRLCPQFLAYWWSIQGACLFWNCHCKLSFARIDCNFTLQIIPWSRHWGQGNQWDVWGCGWGLFWARNCIYQRWRRA